MKKEELFLIELCKAHLYNKKITLGEDIDYQRLYDICKAQNIIAIAFCVLKQSDNKDIIPKDIYNKFENTFFDTIMRFNLQSNVLHDLDEVLTKNNIRHVFFKGAQIRDYYPVPEARAMSDIDVLIDKANRDKVKDLLKANGYGIKNSNGPVYDYVKDNVLIEMHTQIISGKVGSSNAEEYFQNAIDNASFENQTGYLNAEYNFAYMLTHLAHHFWFYGAGIKLIFDLAVFQNSFSLNYDTVLGIMDEIGLKDFTRVVLSVCYKWFGTGVNYDVNTEKTEAFLTLFGAFGNSNRNIAAVIKRKELEEGKNDGRLLTKLRTVFPSYSKLKTIPYIKFIEGKPWLTPIAWIYRLFYILKNRKAIAIKAAKGMNDEKTSTQAENELRYFEEIGLI